MKLIFDDMYTENNKLIAEFMELKNYGGLGLDAVFHHEITRYPYLDKGLVNGSNSYKPKDMLYHSSWDWLMPVVEKIEEFDNGYTKVCITDESCQISTQKSTINHPLYFEIEAVSESKIKSTYDAVVEFIKWYNENK